MNNDAANKKVADNTINDCLNSGFKSGMLDVLHGASGTQLQNIYEMIIHKRIDMEHGLSMLHNYSEGFAQYISSLNIDINAVLPVKIPIKCAECCAKNECYTKIEKEGVYSFG
jgi:hypothetical protein